MIYRDISECYDKFVGQPSLAVDIETTGLSPWRDKIAVIQLATPAGDVLVDHVLHKGVSQSLRDVMDSTSEWITQNGTSFDLPYLAYNGFKMPEQHHDTLIAEKVLDTQMRKFQRNDLGSIQKRRLGTTTKMKIDHRTWQLPELTTEQIMYAAGDVVLMHKLRDKQLKLAVERNLSLHMQKEMELSLCLVEMRMNGWAIDLANLAALQEQLMRDAEHSIARVKLMAGKTFSPTSPNDMERFLCQKLKIQVPLTPKGNPSFNKAVLNELVPLNPIVGDILTWRAAKKRVDFYDPDWIDAYYIDGRIHPDLKPMNTETCRFSCKDPNMQQIPRNMRGMIGGEEGRLVVQADYGQIETRIAAFFSQDEALMEALDSEDLHTEMAIVCFNEPEPDSELRSLAKGITFGELYLGSAKTVQRTSRMQGRPPLPLEQCQAVINRLRSRFSTLHRWRLKQARSNRSVPTPVVLPWGAKRYIQPEFAYGPRLVNTKVQGAAAIGMKEGILEIFRRGLGEYISGSVHDEIVACSVPEMEAEDYAVELADAMRQGMVNMMEDWAEHSDQDYVFPNIVVDPVYGTHWSK